MNIELVEVFDKWPFSPFNSTLGHPLLLLLRIIIIVVALWCSYKNWNIISSSSSSYHFNNNIIPSDENKLFASFFPFFVLSRWTKWSEKIYRRTKTVSLARRGLTRKGMARDTQLIGVGGILWRWRWGWINDNVKKSSRECISVRIVQIMKRVCSIPFGSFLFVCKTRPRKQNRVFRLRGRDWALIGSRGKFVIYGRRNGPPPKIVSPIEYGNTGLRLFVVNVERGIGKTSRQIGTQSHWWALHNNNAVYREDDDRRYRREGGKSPTSWIFTVALNTQVGIDVYIRFPLCLLVLSIVSLKNVGDSSSVPFITFIPVISGREYVCALYNSVKASERFFASLSYRVSVFAFGLCGHL